MPYQPRQFAPVPLPQGESPLRTASDLLSLAGGFQQYEAQGRRLKDDEKVRQREDAIDAALTETKGHFGKAADRLDTQGQWEAATLLRDEADKRRSAAVSSALERTNQHKTLFGQAAQMLQETADKPDLYPQLRPKLVDLATTLDPRLAGEIPEQYEPDRVRGMLQFAQGGAQQAETQARALKAFQDSQTMTDDRVKRAKSQTEAVGGMLSIAPSEEYWNHILETATDWGVGEDVVGAFRKIPWSREAPKLAASLASGDPPSTPANIEAAILVAHQRGDAAEVRRLTALLKDVSDAKRAPDATLPTDYEALAARVLDQPSLYHTFDVRTRTEVAKRLPRGFKIPTRETSTDDDQGLPRAVMAYIDDLYSRGYTREEAEQEFRATNQRAMHPKMDALKVKKAFDEFWPWNAGFNDYAKNPNPRRNAPGQSVTVPTTDSPGLPTDFEGIVEQDGVRYRITTDSAGKVTSSQVVR